VLQGDISSAQQRNFPTLLALAFFNESLARSVARCANEIHVFAPGKLRVGRKGLADRERTPLSTCESSAGFRVE
jgi:hypothetical protein